MGAVADGGLQTVVRRALTNYLAGSPAELVADLTPDARVSVPTLSLRLRSILRLSWAPGGGAVSAEVQVEDARGVHYTLGYEIDVLRMQGRWEVSAMQTDPSSQT
jgi:hypothetical protein